MLEMKKRVNEAYENIARAKKELEETIEKIEKNNDFELFGARNAEHLESLKLFDLGKLEDFEEVVGLVVDFSTIHTDISDRCDMLEDLIKLIFRFNKRDFIFIDDLFFNEFIDYLIYELEKNVLYVPSRSGHLVECCGYYEGIQEDIVNKLEECHELDYLINNYYRLIFVDDLDKMVVPRIDFEEIIKNQSIDEIDEEEMQEMIKEYDREYDRIIDVLFNKKHYKYFDYVLYIHRLR